MKYLPVQDFDAVTGALNFNTPDCNVTGGCDLYTTKSTGSDKKLYKTIDNDLNTQHAAFLKMGASLSPPDREAMMATSPGMQLFSHSSPFGPLSELSSRRTFAYLIATLNASHQHYDFSHVLRPGDFKREKNIQRVIANLDSILQNVRPHPDSDPSDVDDSSPLNHIWGPKCWAMINKEMRLNECTIFSYNPDVDPFEEEESAIWSSHYFFFNRTLKRVAYLYVRVVPVVSSQSPSLRPMMPGKRARSTATIDAVSNNKRAKYWLGDRDAEVAASYDDDDDDPNDGYLWNRGADGDLVPFDDYDFTDGDTRDYYDEDDEFDDNSSDMRKSPVRDMSEDLVANMDM